MLTITRPSIDDPVFKAEAFMQDGNNEPVITLSECELNTGALKVQAMQIANICALSVELNLDGSTPLRIRLDEPALLMCFTLGGQLDMQVYADENFSLSEQTHFTFPAPANSGAELMIRGSAKLFVACFYGDVLPRLFSSGEQQVLKGKLASKGWRIGRPVTIAMNDIINVLLQRADNDILHQIYMAAKMLELLFISLEQLKDTGRLHSAVVKTKDLEKLEQAKQIIQENLKQPYSLIELAHKVGLNDFKLKKGFREAFGNTVFGYLLDVRMEKAATMLSSGNYKVSEVAHEVGYKNAHHFSDAFKKKFGYLPSKVLVNV